MTQVKTAIEVARQIFDTLPDVAKRSLLPHATPQQQVMAFHMLYGAPIGEIGNPDPAFSHMTNERVGLRLSLLLEEFKELLDDGFGISMVVEFTVIDQADGSIGRFTEIQNAVRGADSYGVRRDGAAVADALEDIKYVATGFMVEMGYDSTLAGREVHAANMTKLGADGKPIIADGSDPRYPKGKVLKGPNYTPPQIALVLGLEGYDNG